MSSTSALEVHDFLHEPSGNIPRETPAERVLTTHNASDRFRINEKSYQQQFSDMYFLRLMTLRPVVEAIAQEAWEDFEVSGEKAHKVDRALDVLPGDLCWITGTIYMDMPLKPNILADITKDQFIIPPPPREKYVDMGLDQTMLEDESGRIRLTGTALQQHELVTGIVVSVLGSETRNGEFNVVDLRIADLPAQKPIPKIKLADGRKRKVALASGLGIGASQHEGLETHLLAEYLLGEAGGMGDHEEAATISRLVLCGNSLAEAHALIDDIEDSEAQKPKSKKYGYDAATYDRAPTKALDSILSSLLPSISVTLMPGEDDPANVSVPQQPLHAALFPTAKLWDGSTFERVTNPWVGEIDGVSFLATSGQNLDDMYKYVEGNDRLAMSERLLRWRNIAPTAPDTLWSYPFQEGDPFVLDEDMCPHVFVIGNQPKFETTVIEGNDGQKVRVILVPRFDATGEIVVLDLDTLEPERMCFKVEQ
ncbi:DNA polymeras-like protein subunit delta-2 [Sphaerosporella brunnea]|uniref:DNA-directed DNA polymerase n=1 Tax=Sphaerosporella brunnea TaxID=1250544 RepID=A0A5J5EXV8_9PEZI|nr:DNA polymeras-like protein subunit delta-2 [Sphaerosporella brunnea]